MIVILESPYAGDVERNVQYARRCMRDSLLRGETPFASHLLYTQHGILDDTNPQERHRGINAGYEFWETAQKMVVYRDYGISRGMASAVDQWITGDKEIEFRTIGKNEVTQ